MYTEVRKRASQNVGATVPLSVTYVEGVDGGNGSFMLCGQRPASVRTASCYFGRARAHSATPFIAASSLLVTNHLDFELDVFCSGLRAIDQAS